MIKLTFAGNEEVIQSLRGKGPQIVATLSAKMTSLMIQLQSHIVGETIEQFFPNGAPKIAASVRAIPTTQLGTVIHGEVEAGGPATTKEVLGGHNAGQLFDYAAIQEEGVPHGWEIQPALYANAQAISLKKRALAGLPRALAFTVNGRLVIVRRVYHGPLRARPFMLAGLEDMEQKIIYDLRAALAEAIAT